MKWLIGGITGKSFLDVWSIFHLSFWLFIGSCLWAWRVDRAWAYGVCLALAYAWELFERYGEGHYPKVWLNPESWYNSYLSDPLTCVVGLAFAFYVLDNWRVS
jgi:hypothetical protein